MMGKKMFRIRKGRLSDIETIVDFQQKMAKETERLILKKQTVTKGVRAVFRDKRKGTYYIVEDEGEAAGMLMTIPEWSDWRNSTVLWIHSLYIRPQYRGKGAFKKMYQFLKKRVQRSNSLSGLRLYVEKENISARRVYEKLEMTKDHYLMYEWLK